MDLKALLGKLDVLEGTMTSAKKHPTGPEFTGYWKGTDTGTPGKKLVGDSILKDLSKGKTPKSKEQELSEEFQAFLEAEFKDTVDKRPARKNARPTRGHAPQSGYKTIKADEAVGQTYTVVIDRKGREKPVTGTMEELLDYFGYTLETGKSYEHERGRYKINLNPKNAEQLVDALNKAATNAAANSSPSTYYSVREEQVDEGVAYKAANPHPASKDPIVARVLKQMRPGLTGLEMNNEAFLYFAYELGKQRARDAWEDYGPAIKHFYQSGIGVNEGWESGPEEYKEPYDDADDAYDRMRQDKIDTEAEREWAKLPKVSTYKLTGRGPNMEPNYEFGDEFDTLEQALKYREEIMKDPKTPYPEHIGIRTITRVVNKEQTNEAIYTAPRNQEEYDAKMLALQDLQTDRNNVGHKDLQDRIAMYLANLEKLAIQKGWKTSQPAEESRGHKIVATKLKDIERAKKFASGELKIPTPQERQAQLKQLEKEKSVKEFVAAPTQGTATQTMQQKTQAQDPKQAQAVAQATQAMKSATGSSAPATTLAKALDTASQGKPVMGQEAAALQPLMKDMATVAQDPKLSGSFKSLVNQINQAQIRQK